MTKLIEFNGETHSVSDWARIYGIGVNVLNGRLRAGHSFEESVRNPVHNPKKIYKSVLNNREKQREAILEFTLKNPGANCHVVASHFGISTKTVSAYIRRLSHAKLIQISKYGEYFEFGKVKQKTIQKMELDLLPVRRIFKSQAEWYQPETRI